MTCTKPRTIKIFLGSFLWRMWVSARALSRALNYDGHFDVIYIATSEIALPWISLWDLAIIKQHYTQIQPNTDSENPSEYLIGVMSKLAVSKSFANHVQYTTENRRNINDKVSFISHTRLLICMHSRISKNNKMHVPFYWSTNFSCHIIKFFLIMLTQLQLQDKLRRVTFN